MKETVRQVMARFGYYKLDADDIVEIVSNAKDLAEQDGYDYWPTILFNPTEIHYIQKSLEAAE